MRIFLFLFIALLTACALVASWVSFTGRRELEAVRSDLLAKGEKLTQTELLSPPVPDEQNFFSDPLWQRSPVPPQGKRMSPFEVLDTPLSDAEKQRQEEIFPNLPAPDGLRSYQARRLAEFLETAPTAAERLARASFIREVLAPLTPGLAKMHDLLDRPGAKMPFSFERWYLDETFELFPGFGAIAKALAARAQAGLALGESQAAARDIIDLLRLSETLRGDPLLYSQMMRLNLATAFLPSLRQGTAAHAWSETELLQFQKILDSLELLPGIALAFRGERGLYNQVFEALPTNPALADSVLKTLGSSWLGKAPWQAAVGPTLGRGYLAIAGPGDMAALNRFVQEIVEAVDDAPRKGYHPISASEMADRTKGHTQYITGRFLFLVAGNFDVAALKQNEIRLAGVACALERYRLKNQSYPERLEELVPEFLSALPQDTFNLSRPRYRRTAEAYDLRFVGANGRETFWNKDG